MIGGSFERDGRAQRWRGTGQHDEIHSRDAADARARRRRRRIGVLFGGGRHEVAVIQPRGGHALAENAVPLGRRVFAPVAIAPEHVRRELGGEGQVVMVGADTLAAKVDKHGRGRRGLRPADFGRVQEILDRGELVERSGRNRAFALKTSEGWWLAVVKPAPGGELILSSLYPIDERRLAKVRERGTRAEGR